MPAERLQKVLAQAGVASRRASEDLIAAGRVSVNGRPAELGQSADPATDEIMVDGRRVGPVERTIHFALHKPAGYVSSARDERGRHSVLRLVEAAPEAAGVRLWPAGRLDVESEGLMVLTNDGAWANRLLHPRYGMEREYAVLVDRAPHPDQLVALLDGVQLEDGRARLLEARPAAPPREVHRDPAERGTWLRVRLGEGRKREVRRLMAAVGLRVRRLVRVGFGPLALDGLEPGEWRVLDAAEVQALVGSGSPTPGDPGRRRRGRLAVAIDGPSGSGKSTIGFALAERIGATFVDTGLMYRALTLAAVQAGVDPDDEDRLAKLARAVRIEVERPRPDQTDRRETVLLDGKDVTDAARRPRVDRLVSAVSRHAAVRQAMLGIQRAAARRQDTVMVGRDIGTVVLPDATLKVYLTATAEVRAARRAAEMGRPERIETYLAEIRQRDEADSGRPVAPLRKAEGAMVLDTGELGVDACLQAIVEHLPGRPARAAGASVQAKQDR
ncbi:MAG TPA: (d)CMP kinase [Candidatus Limnocylindria bacterium]|nr:(d)CMP kinase [Candidatus Limnocylindria bacterium]